MKSEVQKRISVVIPTYNCSRYIPMALRSVLEQSYGDIEIIVVDDGSTDDTRNVVQPFLRQIKYLYQSNRGVSASRNLGIAEATGEYIALLDADDRWEKNKLKMQEAILDSLPSIQMVFSDFNTIDENGRRASSAIRQSFPFFREFKYPLCDIFQQTSRIPFGSASGKVSVFHGRISRYLFCGNFILPSSVLMRKAAIVRIGGFDESFSVAEDTEYFLRFCTGNEVAFVDIPLVDYFIRRPGNLTEMSNVGKMMENGLKVQLDYIEKYPDIYKKNRDLFDMAVSKAYSRKAYYYLTTRTNEEARSQAARSIKWKPLQIKAYLYFLFGLLSPSILDVMAETKKRLRVSIGKQG